MIEMTVDQTEDGKWQVTRGDVVIAGPFDTNAEAWRWIDRKQGEPVNRQEATAADFQASLGICDRW
jgi:hypothetical protein